MNIDFGSLLSILSLLIIGPVGWLLRAMIVDVRKIQAELNEHKSDVHRNYVTKADLHRDLGEIKSMISRVFEKLDQLSSRE